MLEKQKVWVQEKKEKGKEWFKAHKLGIGIAAGSVATVGLQVLKKRILKIEGYSVETGHNTNLGEGNFWIRVTGKDRFGREIYTSPLVRYYDGLEDAERINKGILAAINEEEFQEF